MTEHNEPYQPIACGQHSQYELAVMHRLMLQLAWRDETGQAHIAKVMPLDMKTEHHAEFLIAQSNDGIIHHIRLDKIDHTDVAEVTRA